MSPRASQVIREAEAIAGYTTYIELIQPLIEGKQVVSTAMKKRSTASRRPWIWPLPAPPAPWFPAATPGFTPWPAWYLKCAGNARSPISAASDPENEKSLSIEIVPGIPALCSGASLLGAPLTHDFAAISLSDLLTPWETIEARLEAAARADFVIVLYNPKSHRRIDHLIRAQEIALAQRDGSTPVGIVTGAMRDNQRVTLTTLDRLHEAEVDMQTTVFIGNSNTFAYDGFMVTPRGYSKKYDIG